MFPRHPFELIVSLPSNDPVWAKAAQEGGATAIKVHLNCHHPASGTLFGSWKQEKEAILAVLKEVSIPVGVMPGHGLIADYEELLECQKAGLSFVDLYREDVPQWLSLLSMQKMIALSSKFYSQKTRWEKENFGDILEASFVPKEEYGKRLTEGDFNRYKDVVARSPVPVFVPTQKKILPEDLSPLRDIGIKGLILGTVVLGKEEKSFAKKISAYARVLR